MLSVYAVDQATGETVAVDNWAQIQFLERWNDTAGGTLTTKSVADYDQSEWLDILYRWSGAVFVTDEYGRAWSGFPYPTITVNSDGSATIVLVGDFGHLAGYVVTPTVDPANWVSFTHRTYSGPVRTALAQMVNDYAVTGPEASGLMAVAADPGGPDIAIASRASGTLADWVKLKATPTSQRVSVVWDQPTSKVLCMIEGCADLSASISFAPQLNLAGWSQVVTRPSTDQVIVAGQGEGSARQVVVRTSAETGWRRQSFSDQRNIDNLADLEAEADELLEAGRGSTSITATLLETPDQLYGVDFRLGDLVKVTAAGAEFVEPVTAVLTQATPEGGVSRTVTAGFGPLNPATRTAADLAELSRKVSQIGAS